MKRMTNKQIKELIKERIELYQHQAKIEDKYTDSISEKLRERAYALVLLLEEIEMIEE